MPKGVPRNGFRMTKNRIMSSNFQSSPCTTTNTAAPSTDSRFSINERFGFVDDMVSMVAKRQQQSVIITGSGGLGKTYTVLESLAKNNLTDVSTVPSFEAEERFDSRNIFRVISGYASPKGLYRTLYENRKGILVFDDCDSILENPVSISLLKGALDSYSRRIISWMADIKDDDLETSFEFEGSIAFISNIPSNLFDQALLSRSMVVDLTMTPDQKIERMRYLLSQTKFMPEFQADHKEDALALIDLLKDQIKDLSLRSLIKCTKIRANGQANWMDLAEYTMC